MFELKSYQHLLIPFQQSCNEPPAYEQTLHEQAREHIERGDFYQAILALHILDDHQHGIYSRIDNGVYYRILKQSEQSRELDKRYVYAILGLNLALTAKKMLRTRGILEEAPLNRATMIFIEALLAETHTPSLRHHLGHFNQTMIEPLLAEKLQLPTVQVQRYMKLTRPFVMLDEPPLKVINEFTVAERTYYHLDLPVTQPTAQQLSWLHNYRNEPWYTSQSNYVRALMVRAIPKLLAGHMLPTSMRRLMPGLRNSGHELVFKKGLDLPLLSCLHSGTLAQDFRDTTNTPYTAENIRQAANHFGHSNIHIVNLLTPTFMGGEDKRISEQLADGIQQFRSESPSTSVNYSNPAVNFFRHVLVEEKFGARAYHEKFSGVRSLIDSARTYLEDPEPNCIEENQHIEALVSELSQQLTQVDILDLNNHNIQIGATSRILCGYLNRVHGEQRYTQLDACKSGKERGGILRLLSVIRAVELDISSTETPPEEIYRAIVSMRIIQKQAALHGNSYGADSLKPVSIPALPAYLHSFAPHLFSRTANFGVSMPRTDFSQLEKFLFACLFLMSLPVAFLGIGIVIGLHILNQMNDRLSVRNRVVYD